MRAVVCTPDGPSRTELHDGLPEPQPAADEAIVEVRAFAVNRGELSLLAMRDRWIPGQDVAGTVVQAAADRERSCGGRAGGRPGGVARLDRARRRPDRAHGAVQLATLGGARVTAVARGERGEAVRALGADDVVAATADAEDGAYDVILESDGGASLTAAVAKVGSTTRTSRAGAWSTCCDCSPTAGSIRGSGSRSGGSSSTRAFRPWRTAA